MHSPKSEPLSNSTKIIPKSPSQYSRDQERFLELLESCINYSEIEHTFPLNLEVKTEIEVLEKIKQKIYSNTCAKCQKTGEMLRNECGHQFCVECSIEMVKELQDCFVCGEELVRNFEIKTLGKYRGEQGKKPRILCVWCKKEEIKRSFKGKCNHLCIGCVQKIYEAMESECPVCFQPLFNDSVYFEYKELCHGCGQAKYFIGDFFAKLDCGHIFCIECSEDALRKRLCKLCGKTFNQKQLLDTMKKCCQQCNECLKIFSKTFITLNPSYNKFICGECSQPCHK